MSGSNPRIAAAPASLVALVTRDAPSSRRGQGTVVPLRAVSEGGRNSALTSALGREWARGASPEAMLTSAFAINAATCRPPLTDGEVRSIVASIMRYARGVGPISDLICSRMLVERLAGDAFYDPAAGVWMFWGGTRWCADTTGAIDRAAKSVLDDLAIRAGAIQDPAQRKRALADVLKAQAAPRIAAMIQLAKTEPGVQFDASRCDADPDALNTPQGIIDLRTGALRPHAREAFATKITGCDYDPAATCPRFLQFIDEITGGDTELAAYLWLCVGYALTGHTCEQVLFVLVGSGSNGKSLILRLLRMVLGDYAYHAPAATLLATRGSATNDLVALRGRRFVSLSEADEGARMASALLKGLTGDDPITARLLFREFVTFQPVAKIFYAVNHLPEMNADDGALWRRIRALPFSRVFTEGEQDHNLAAKLAAEMPGILNWLIAGAVAWHRDGLGHPEVIRAATNAHRVEQDAVGLFLDEHTEVDPRGAVEAGGLYALYRIHTNNNGGDIVSLPAFGRALTRRGFKAEKRAGRRVRAGLTLKGGM